MALKGAKLWWHVLAYVIGRKGEYTVGGQGNMHENKTSREDVGQRENGGGRLGDSAVWRLPSAQGVILETQDRVPHQAPCVEPASPSVSLSLSLMNK